MIYSLRGKLLEKNTDSVVIECGGVGYFAKASYNTLSQINDINNNDEDVFVYTYMNFFQDGAELFAFYDKQEMRVFKMLVSVSGVGPRAALSVLSVLTPQQFALAVASGDSKKITAAKGVGKKMADRIILELKDKLAKSGIKQADGYSTVSQEINMTNNSELDDAIAALEVLGYSYSEIAPFLSNVDINGKSSDIIKNVLKIIGSKK